MKTILLVDDESILLSFFTRIISRMGVHVLTATTVEQGLRIFTDQRPDGVFLDITLPDGNGVDLFKKMKTLDPLAKICFLSGSDHELQDVESKKVGAIAYLPKPVYAEDIQKVVKVMIGAGS